MSVKVRQENVLDCGALQYVYTTSREMIVIFPRYNTHPVRSAEFTAAECGLLHRTDPSSAEGCMAASFVLFSIEHQFTSVPKDYTPPRDDINL